MILGGILQVILGLLGVAKLMRYIPRSVMVGFVNALAILIFIAQVPQLIGVPWAVYPIAAAGLAIMYLLPRVTKVVPAPLVAIVLLTGAAVVFGISVPTVGDQGALPESLPALLVPNVPLTGETLGIILPFAVAMAIVGLLESLMTAALVDDITDTPSSKTRESLGQGAANVLSGLFGGMGGCAMIGQTMINVKASGSAHAYLDVPRRTLPARARPGLRRRRRDHPDGGARRGDDRRVDRDVRLAQHPTLDPATDAAERDDRDGADRRDHRVDA